MEFVAIDFETANASRNSACSIGIVTIKGNKIVDEYYHLIRPDDLWFDPYNVEIHGITEEMVANEPRFNELWEEILPRLQGKQVIAHYAQFDMSVLRFTLKCYNIPFPCFDYLCTWALSKQAMPELVSYKLNNIADSIGFKFNHHNALEDAKACAAIFENILEKYPSESFQDLADKLNLKCGKMNSDSYIPCGVYNNSSSNTNLGKITSTTEDINPNHYFYGKNIAFTGTLLSMSRKNAVQEIVNKGAIFSKSITKITNILVFGYQDPKKFAENATNSSKFIKAQKLRAEGQDIEILNEDDFIKILRS